MNILLPILITSCIISSTFLFLSRRRRHRFISNRENLDLKEIYRNFFESNDIDIRNFYEIWEKTASFYRIEPGKLRPSDEFDGFLKIIDADIIGDGATELEQYMREQGIVVRGRIKNLEELVKIYDSHKKT